MESRKTIIKLIPERSNVRMWKYGVILLGVLCIVVLLYWGGISLPALIAIILFLLGLSTIGFVGIRRSELNLGSGIESNPNVCGGSARIIGTRIPIWVLEQARRLGTSEIDLLRSYPRLKAEDLALAWAYVRFHQREIDREIKENEEA